MDRNSLHYIIKSIDFIERNINKKITLDDLSLHVNLSKFYLDRLFHQASKITLMDYVKKRKLSCSINELLNTDLKICDIATEYGFNYEQSYIRAFEKTFSISPDRFRKQKPQINITDKVNLDYIKAIGENAIIITPEIVVKPEFLIAGIKYKIREDYDIEFFEANAKGNDFYFNRKCEIKNIINPNIYIGLVDHNPEEEGYCYYMPSVQVSHAHALPTDMMLYKVPTNKYAIFKYIGLHHAKETNTANLFQTLYYIYSEWLPKSGYLESPAYHFEMFDENITSDDYCEVDLYIPIKL